MDAVFWDVNALWFLQESHGATYQKTTFFIVTAVKTSNLKQYYPSGLYSGDVIFFL
jgi:hypothetical protein